MLLFSIVMFFLHKITWDAIVKGKLGTAVKFSLLVKLSLIVFHGFLTRQRCRVMCFETLSNVFFILFMRKLCLHLWLNSQVVYCAFFGLSPQDFSLKKILIFFTKKVLSEKVSYIFSKKVSLLFRKRNFLYFRTLSKIYDGTVLKLLFLSVINLDFVVNGHKRFCYYHID